MRFQPARHSGACPKLYYGDTEQNFAECIYLYRAEDENICNYNLLS